ncbi:MAG: L,D-transpeptidase [Akkermansiaceae bacterium]
MWRIYLALAGATFLVSCSTSSLSDQRYKEFKSRPDYRQTHDVYKDETLLKTADSANTRVKIDLSDQRAQLLIGEQVALDTPCSTGKAGKRTPSGEFAIKQKIVSKRSTIFGRLYRGSRRVYSGDRRRYRGRYTRFVGSSLPYWMRLTNGGIGMHYSRGVRRYACSNGCIRLPMHSVKTIFANTRVGTPVTIQH